MFSVNRILNKPPFLFEAKRPATLRDMQTSYSAEPGSRLCSETRHPD